MKKLHLFKTVLLLCALMVGSGSAWADRVIWEEDWSSGSANDQPSDISNAKATYAQSSSNTKLYAETLAGGTSPELLVAKGTTSTFTATVNLGGHSGELTFTFKTNGTNIALSSTTKGVTVTGTMAKGDNTFTIDVPANTESLVLVFTSTTGNKNTRLDDLMLTAPSAASPLASIAVSGTYPTVFHQGDAFSHEGMTVTATYENSTTKDVTSDAEFSTPDMTTTGNKTITVSYTENEVTKTTSYIITVNAPATLESISLSGTYTTTFNQGDTFEHDGLIVTAHYDDETSKNVTEDAGFSGYNMSTAGDQTVTVSYTESGETKTATYDITVNAYVQPTTVTFNITQSMFEGVTFNANNQTSEASISTTVDNVEMTINKGNSNTYVKDGEFRCYKNGTLVFEAPSNYVMTEIDFTKGSSWGMDEANSGVLSSQTWTGEASDVTFSFTGRTDITEVVVTLMEVEEVTMNAAGYATFASTKPLDLTDLPEGLTAYKAKVSGANVTFSPIEQEISANTGILLKGDEDEKYYIPVAAGGTSVDGNEFQVNTSGSTFSGTSGKLYFALKKSAGDLLFGTFDPASLAIPANKAYLIVDESAFETPARELSISFEDGETTGVADVRSKMDGVRGEYFDLQGRKVAQPTKGLYIVNGKKVVIK